MGEISRAPRSFPPIALTGTVAPFLPAENTLPDLFEDQHRHRKRQHDEPRPDTDGCGAEHAVASGRVVDQQNHDHFRDDAEGDEAVPT
jgi:hypothetical protein